MEESKQPFPLVPLPCKNCRGGNPPTSITGIFPGSKPKANPGSIPANFKPIISKIPDATNKRLYFPKTWIWEDVHLRGRSIVTLTKKLPGTMTTWITSAFGVGDADGFGILDDNEKLKIPVFLPFFIELKNPSIVIAGNSAVIKITLFNNIPFTKMVYVHIQFQSQTSGFSRQIAGRNSTLYFHDIQLQANRYGNFNVTVVAYDMMQGFQILDWIQKPITVKAPGLQQMYNIPYFFTMINRMSSDTKNIRITLPNHAIKGTESVYLTVTGDIMAPTISGLGHLIRRPCGCGEQTMMFLAPNIYVIHYLRSTNQLSAGVKTRIVTNINRGIDNELRYQKPDGSFSVWGNRDRHGSTWLTSFVLLCFHQADSFVPVDRNIFTRGIDWLMEKQNIDGSFREHGYVIHYQMQGGVRASRATITAYVLLTLLENKDIREYRQKIGIAERKAVQYLTRSSVIRDLQNSNHAMAITSYVLQKAGYSRKARQLYSTLKRRSKTSGGYLFWQDNGNKMYKQKLSWHSPNPRARPIDIETSAYALLYLTERRDVTEGMKILKWLVSQRNPEGGFTSTQDTVVSLHALSRFSSMLQQSTLDARVSVKSGSTTKTVHVTQQNKQLIQRMELGKGTSNVEIKTQGRGLVLVDTVVKYNVMKSEDSAFNITTSINPLKQTFDKITVNVCVRRKDNKDNGMVVAEVGVPCGFLGDLTKTNARGLEHKETSSDAVVLYFKNLRGSKVCFDVTASRVDKVTESQAIPITVYDYYEPVNYGISSYRSGKLKEMNLCNICKHCSICRGIELG
ncbi:CD109 antigen-like [Saccostrea cucullata]|uniref:CD109 antigen-like n=1 Tax=Saccostrea cuccullata TaxID=36930 RepID=UPI002ED407DB